MMFLQKLIAKVSIPFVALWNIIKDRIHLVRLGSKIPGDTALPILGNVFLQFEPNSESVLEYSFNLHERVGDIYRMYIGPLLEITTSNILDAEKILSGYEYLKKGMMYAFLKPWLGTGLLISSGEKWRTRRKLLTPAFHFNILEQFIPVFNSCGDEFVQQLRKRAGGEAFEVWQLVKLLTLDVICESTMGVSMNTQTNSSSSYVKAVNEISSLVYEYSMRPWLYIRFIFRRSKIGRRFQKCLDILHGTTDRVIRERREELQKMESWNTSIMDIDEIGRRRRVAFLDLLLLAARDGSLSDVDIREEVDTFMFEGHDTTAAAISFTLYLLSMHEDAQNKILHELESIFDRTKPLEPTIQQLSELRYLEMVIKESLRLYPPVPAVSREISSDFPFPSRSLTAPKGSELFMSFFLMHRKAENYPDPEKFDPERFSPDECARRHPYAFLPFSAGPRNCIGQRFAMLEMKHLLAKVIWNFRLLPDPTFTLEVMWEIILKSKTGIFIKIQERR